MGLVKVPALPRSWSHRAAGIALFLASAGSIHCSTAAPSPPTELQAAGRRDPVVSPSRPSVEAPSLPPPAISSQPDASAPDVVATEQTKPASEPGQANLDPTDDQEVGPPSVIPDCQERLKALNVAVRNAELPVRTHKGLVCGAPQVVQVTRGTTGVRYQPAPLLSCGMALALGRFEAVMQKLAQELLDARVVSVTQGGTYSCRKMARFSLVSEHSYANAIDLRSFGLSDGRTVSVQRHFGDPKQPPKTTEGRFLRELAQRLYDEDVFSVVVTRYFDRLHFDHIHVDLARYRTDGTR